MTLKRALGIASIFVLSCFLFSYYKDVIRETKTSEPITINQIFLRQDPDPLIRLPVLQQDISLPENNISVNSTIDIEGCLLNCKQNLKDSTSSKFSLCSERSDNRGAGQKVISFSFYGELRSAYYNGIKENLQSIDTFYPGWLMRVYLDPTTVDEQSSVELCKFSCESNRVDLCSVRNLLTFGDVSEKFGMVWRFLPMADPSVDFMLSRDLDSRFSVREVAAVQDWIQSGFPFHSMRDHPAHGVPVLGGMWGARTDLSNRERYKCLITNMVDKMGDRWFKGYDQDLLATMWLNVNQEAIAHDSYLCTRFSANQTRPWPTQRLAAVTGNFVGSNSNLGEMQINKPCPKECRPKEHPDWELC